MLLDPEFGAPHAIAAGALPGTTALGVPLEAQGFGQVPDAPCTTFLPGWSPAEAARLGAAACKLLLPYRVDLHAQAEVQEAVARRARDACRRVGLALILEPIVYALEGERPAGPTRLDELVVEGARRQARLEPDVLKLQYPGSPEACRALDEACGSAVPWALLGGGGDAEAVTRKVEQACSAGASGFIVERTLFDAALVADAKESERALRESCRPLLERLAVLARRLGTPWRQRVGDVGPPRAAWYR